jgi:hypothetical protein
MKTPWIVVLVMSLAACTANPCQSRIVSRAASTGGTARYMSWSVIFNRSPQRTCVPPTAPAFPRPQCRSSAVLTLITSRPLDRPGDRRLRL